MRFGTGEKTVARSSWYHTRQIDGHAGHALDIHCCPTPTSSWSYSTINQADVVPIAMALTALGVLAAVHFSIHGSTSGASQHAPADGP
jgi:hypothetical protein